MKNADQYLLGKTIDKTVISNFTLTIIFSDDSSLVIYNKYIISGMPEDNLSGTITSIGMAEDSVIFTLSPRGHIEVRLDSDAFSGPEAMVYSASSGDQIVVWP